MTLDFLPRPQTDQQLQKSVQDELRWDTHISDAAAIGVAVDNHIVTLTGRAPSYAEKIAACDAAHRVKGVQDVANDIAVIYPGEQPRTDTEIAQTVRHALEWNILIPEQNIQSTVAGGWVTLEGKVTRWSHRYDAEQAIRNIPGTRGVTNSITIIPPKPSPEPAQIRSAIEAALNRQTEREARQIGITVQGGTVTLTGTVRSWSEKFAAAETAGSAPGVCHINNQLSIGPV